MPCHHGWHSWFLHRFSMARLIWKLLAFKSLWAHDITVSIRNGKARTVSWIAWDTNCYNLIDDTDSIGNATCNRNKKKIEKKSLRLNCIFIPPFWWVCFYQMCSFYISQTKIPCDVMLSKRHLTRLRLLLKSHVVRYEFELFELFGRISLFLSIRQSHKMSLRITTVIHFSLFLLAVEIVLIHNGSL